MRDLRVLHFATQDIGGGGFNASYQIHRSLQDLNHSSKLIVRNKISSDNSVVQVSTISRYQKLYHLSTYKSLFLRKTYSSSYVFNFNQKQSVKYNDIFKEKNIDLICLHWITNFLDTQLISLLYQNYKVPIFWTLMDLEPITGGCHYTFGCDKFTQQCGSCPQLLPSFDLDQSRKNWESKKKLVDKVPITIIAPTSWVYNKVKKSSIFVNARTALIPLPIDPKSFYPLDKSTAKSVLNINPDQKVIFFPIFSYDQPRKGMNYLLESLNKLCVEIDNSDLLFSKQVICLLAGYNDYRVISMIPFRSRYLGYLKDTISLALAYQAADVFISSSIEDAGPMMVPEAMMCGTPVVAFNIGGAPDLIDEERMGYVIDDLNTTEMARAILKILLSNSQHNSLVIANKTRFKHDPYNVSRSYYDLYCAVC